MNKDKNLLTEKQYGLYTETEKEESWKNGINPGQGHTKSFEEAAKNISDVLGLNFTKNKITQLREDSGENTSRNKI